MPYSSMLLEGLEELTHEHACVLSVLSELTGRGGWLFECTSRQSLSHFSFISGLRGHAELEGSGSRKVTFPN
jgi:hypothetical protein